MQALAGALRGARGATSEVCQRTLVIDDKRDITDGLKELLELEQHQVLRARR